MLLQGIFILNIFVISSSARPQNDVVSDPRSINTQEDLDEAQNNELPKVEKKDIQITKFHVTTDIQMR